MEFWNGFPNNELLMTECSVTMTVTDAAGPSESGIHENRLRVFGIEQWLLGNRLAEAGGRSSAGSTSVWSPERPDIKVEPQKHRDPKVSQYPPEQMFDGVVISLDRDVEKTFWARLADGTATMPDEEVEIPLEEVSSDDWPLIVPGALFTWNIGREKRDGQIRRVSEIRFRRMIRFSRSDVERAVARAATLESLIAESHGYPSIDPP